MIDSSAAAPPLLLQLVLQQQTKFTGYRRRCSQKRSVEDEEVVQEGQ